MYEVYPSRRAGQFLDKLDKHIKERIVERLKRLGEDPYPSDSKFIGRDEEGEKIFRYRIGDFRALYLINEVEKKVLITKIEKRSRIYD